MFAVKTYAYERLFCNLFFCLLKSGVVPNCFDITSLNLGYPAHEWNWNEWKYTTLHGLLLHWPKVEQHFNWPFKWFFLDTFIDNNWFILHNIYVRLSNISISAQMKSYINLFPFFYTSPLHNYLVPLDLHLAELDGFVM